MLTYDILHYKDSKCLKKGEIRWPQSFQKLPGGESLFLAPLGLYPGVELLGPMVTVYLAL